MELNTYQQIFESLGKAGKVLIALPEQLTADNVGSGLSLALFLRKMNKEVTLASSSPLPSELSFLPQSGLVQQGLPDSSSFVISLSTLSKAVDEISYQPSEQSLEIYVKSKSEPFEPADVTFRSEQSPFSAIVLLDSPSLEAAGKLFENNANVFLGTAKINIDNHPTNEYYGAINFVDINATSVAEMLADLLGTYEQQLMDEDIATALLTGIITKTNSFQHIQTTPKSFVKASELIALGGRQQEIVQSLYKTKSLSLLRLWGRALARLKAVDEDSLLYSQLSAADFEKSGSGKVELVSVLTELLDNTSAYKVTALLAETDGGVTVLLAVHPQVAFAELTSQLGVQTAPLLLPAKNIQAHEGFMPAATLSQAEQKLLQAVHSN